ncbi:MAG TPA: SpoIIE family protein phosphatase [Ornithinimicrobium sp.]|nr:SpoIIE family protein phosphatase [Ornithinimicrobium sp.]
MPSTRSAQSGAAATLNQTGSSFRRWLREDDRGVVLLLVLFTLVGAAAVYLFEPVGAGVLIFPLFLASLLLPPSRVPWLVGLVLTAVLVVTLAQVRHGFPVARWSSVVTAFAIGLVTLVVSYRRAVLGVAGVRGESMLIDLRERINRQGVLPRLPHGWHAESAARSAGGASFAGDFMVADLSDDGRRLSVAVVDVSGKGVEAGTKSLLLSGAFGGLLSSLPSAGFLPAANDFLMRQDWSEGFATAVHLSLDLATGEFELRSAGHPPAVQLFAGSGRWERAS